jgi:hypothetical protein
VAADPEDVRVVRSQDTGPVSEERLHAAGEIPVEGVRVVKRLGVMTLSDLLHAILPPRRYDLLSSASSLV